MGGGAEAEFSTFVHCRWPQLVRLGFVLTGDTGLAEDLAQTALARVYASWRFWALSVLRHPGPVASWTAYDPAGHPVASGTGPPG